MDEDLLDQGIGCFSNQPVFDGGETDEEAAYNYYETACQAFAGSTEGKAVLEEDEYPGYVHQFLELAITYLGVIVDNCAIQDVEEILLELFPRKVSMEADRCESVNAELAAFWRFVDRVHKVESAGEIAGVIESMSDEFRSAMTDSSNFGIAKSFFTSGQNAGFDMTSQEGLNAFMAAHNANLQRPHPAHIEPVQPAATAVTGMNRKQRKKLLVSRQKRKGR
jgi:hypothetical protein